MKRSHLCTVFTAPTYLLFFGAFFSVTAGMSTWVMDYYHVSKWIILYFFVLLNLIWVALTKSELEYPNSKKLFIAGFGVFILFLPSVIANWNRSFLPIVLDWPCFAVLGLLAFNLTKRRLVTRQWLDFTTVLTTCFVVLYAFLQSVGYEPFASVAHVVKQPMPTSSFGNPSFTAESLGLLILLQVYFIGGNRCGGRRMVLRLILLVGSLVFFYFLSCRAAMLGIVLGITPMLFSNRSLWRVIAITSSACAVLVVLIVVVASGAEGDDANAARSGVSHLLSKDVRDSKYTSAKLRIERWVNTVYLIADHPFGVGPDNYEFEYIPYRNIIFPDPEVSEGNLVFSPHNGFLEAAVEWGWGPGLFLLFLSFVLLSKLYSVGVCVAKRNGFDALFVSVFVYYFVVAQFAFPMDGAYNFFAAAFFAGWCFRECTKAKKLKKIGFRLIAFGLIVVIGMFALRFTASKYLEANASYDRDSVTTACRLWSANWHVCMKKAEIEYFDHDLVASKDTIRGLLKQDPFNFVALRLLGHIFLDEGNQSEACGVFSAYDRLFDNKSLLKSLRDEVCATSE